MSSSNHVQLQAAAREKTGSAESRRLRRAGMVPGVLYKAGERSVAFHVSHHDLERAVHGGHGRTAVFEISVDQGPKVPALIKDWQLNPVRNEFIHVDFQEVDLSSTVQALVPVVLEGLSLGVRGGGVLDQPTREITVEALPDAIPDHIEVDVTDLDIGGVVTFAGLSAPSGVELIGDDEMVIASVTAPTEVGEIEEVEEGAQPELVGGSSEDEDTE